jgi:2Fe-2S ferredoxin
MSKITIHLRTAAGQQRTIQGKAGQTLMRAAIDANVHEIAADCGGCLTCATCHVFVDAAWLGRLPPPSPDEMAMLEMTATPARPGSRLSCQITLAPAFEGLGVELPSAQY